VSEAAPSRASGYWSRLPTARPTSRPSRRAEDSARADRESVVRRARRFVRSPRGASGGTTGVPNCVFVDRYPTATSTLSAAPVPRNREMACNDRSISAEIPAAVSNSRSSARRFLDGWSRALPRGRTPERWFYRPPAGASTADGWPLVRAERGERSPLPGGGAWRGFRKDGVTGPPGLARSFPPQDARQGRWGTAKDPLRLACRRRFRRRRDPCTP
jgi:hypothetical protein